MTSSRDRVTTAVLPVAGLGTRFLPATKVVPKEMLPVAGRPLVQYAVEEAVAAGLGKVVLVMAPGRDLALRHFASDPELEAALEARGHSFAEIRALAELANRVRAVEQAEPLGLGHAVACALSEAGPGPCAVLLPDDLILGDVPCIRQLLDVHAQLGGTVLAVMELPADTAKNFGVIEPGFERAGIVEVRGLVEKPAQGTEPSRLAVVGRYVLSQEACAALPSLAPGHGGELQLTDAIASTIGTEPVYAVRFAGQRFDCGNPVGLATASVEVLLRDPRYFDAAEDALRSLLSGHPGTSDTV